MASLTRWVLGHKLIVSVFWVAVTLVGAVNAGRSTAAMKQTFSVPESEGARTNALITKAFGGGGAQTPLVPVVTLPRGADVDSRKVTSDLKSLAGIIAKAYPGTRVTSYATTHSDAFVSEDGRTTYLFAYTPPAFNAFGGGNEEAQAAISRALEGATVAGEPVHLTGVGPLSASTGGDRDGPGVLAESLIGGLGALVVLAFLFASLLAFVPIVIAFASIMTTFLLVWGMTAFTDVSPIVAFLIGLLGLGVAIDCSLLIVARWREERAQGRPAEEVIVRAMSTAGRTVAFSGLTVAVGLFALVALPLPFLRSIGIAGILIPLVSVAATVTLVPVILATAGPRLDWPHRRKEAQASAAWTRVAGRVVRYRWGAVLVAGGIVAFLALFATTLQFGTGYGDPDVIAGPGPAKAGLEQLERSGIGKGALAPIELVTRGGGGQLAAHLASVPGVHGAVAPAGPGWRRPGLSLVEVVPHEEGSSSAGIDTLKQVRAAAHAHGASVGGNGAAQLDFTEAVYGNFPLMVALIAAVTFLLLARALRSIVLPLKAIALNVLSVAAAWGVVALVWQHGYGSEALWGIASTGTIPAWIPLMVFAFLFGLSMDYEVFILARMREEFDGGASTDRAVIAGIGRTGRIVTGAALILFLAFLSMSSGPDASVKMLATGLAAGILLDATVIRAVFVPAIVSLFGRWNWWLPAWAARVLRVRPSLPHRRPLEASR